MVAAVLCGAAVLVVGAALLVWHARRDARRRAARSEQWQAQCRAGWARGCALASALRMGTALEYGVRGGLVLAPGEVVFAEARLLYSRWGTAAPPPASGGSSVYFFGGGSGADLALAGGLVLSEWAELSRARDDARCRWRGHEQARVLGTDRRLLVFVAGRWRSLPYSAVLGFRPQLAVGELVLEFASASPVRMQGPEVPSIAAVVGFGLFGAGGMGEHPELAALLA